MTYAYTVTGKLGEREVSLSWKDQMVTGDPEALARLHRLARERDGQEIGVDEWWTTMRNHLQSPVSALLLMDELFHHQITTTGTIPKAPPQEEGWI